MGDGSFRSYIAECIGDSGHMVAIAARDKQQVGYIHAGIEKRPPVMEPAAHGVIQECFVAEAVRRQGVGRRLVKEAMNWFRERETAHVIVKYTLANPVSGRFWHALGFRPLEETGFCPLSGG